MSPSRAARGEHDNRHVRALAHRAADVDAVHVRKTEVEHDEIGLVPLDRVESCPAAHRGQHVVSARPQQRGHGGDDVRLVVDDENALRHVYCGTAAVRTAPGTTIENFAPARRRSPPRSGHPPPPAVLA